MSTDEEAIRRFRKSYNLLVILGPTATGKTGLAIGLAGRLGGEIISADSRQVYRGMDLGTGKDLNEYGRGGSALPPDRHLGSRRRNINVFTFQRLFYRCFQEIVMRGNIPLMVGGTGLYLDAVIRGYRLPAVPEDQALREELEKEGLASLRRTFPLTLP